MNGNKIECTQGFTHRDEVAIRIIDDRGLTLMFLKVEILFEELFYNGRYESFRVVCVDRILNTKAQDSKVLISFIESTYLDKKIIEEHSYRQFGTNDPG